MKDSIRHELYLQGLIDREIAEITGVTQGAIWHWRNKHGLQANKMRTAAERQKRVCNIQREQWHDRCMELYQQGLNDREIAEILDVHSTSVSKWRRKNKLPANGCRYGDGGGVPMERALTPDQCEDMERFLSLVLKYADIAQENDRKLDVGAFMRIYRNECAAKEIAYE